MKEEIENFLFEVFIKFCKKIGTPRYKILDLINQQAVKYHQSNSHKPEEFRKEVERETREEIMQIVDKVYGSEKLKA